MEKKLLTEIEKFKLLSNYDNNRTLNENHSTIISEDGLTRDILKTTSSELQAAKTELKAAMSADRNLLKGGVTDSKGLRLTSADDIITALKDNKLTGRDLGDVNKALFKSTNSVAIKNAIAKDIALSDRFLANYSKLSEKEAVNTLISRGYTKEEAKMITGEFKKSGKSFTSEISKVSQEGGNVNKNVNKMQIRIDSATGKQTIKNGETITEVGKTREYKCVTRPNCKKQIKIEEAPTIKTVEDLEKMKGSLNEVSLKAMTPGFNWKKLVAWAAGLGIGAGLLWWYFATSDKKVPDDIPTTPPKDDDNGGGDFPLEDGVYTTPGDPYQYKVVDCVWFTKSWKRKGKIIKDWISLSNNQNATRILDGRHPEARKNCGGNTTDSTVTQTPQDVVNQQYGVTPQPNAQPEVQTTNDDINNY
jgi:hypothetical protein